MTLAVRSTLLLAHHPFNITPPEADQRSTLGIPDETPGHPSVGKGGPSEICVYDMVSPKLLGRSFVFTTAVQLYALSRGVYAYAILNGGTITKEKFVKD